MPATPHPRAAQEMLEPPQIAGFYMKEYWPYSESLTNDLTPHLISKDEAHRPSGKAKIRRLYQRSRSFWSSLGARGHR